ncbi:transporter substrate-binding domain-containing protein [Alteromonas ponticola]|uniref:Transporter substrate-binding domain-containing protein n=1 Tax=Alteromonas aquimaris TaxID=2998417 RepID=A0ABT3P5H2_9ALTE|nr:transporter substrate-binding domain-containing protein [Alteromonas aquimaris]MCW8108021.1 transporter substrate-binding domain-containing protein [Alteromonas aquimaris]
MSNQITKFIGIQKTGIIFSWLLCLLFSAVANSELQLASVPFSTYVSQNDGIGRLNDLIKEALKRSQIEANLSVMRPAFLGSGLSNESLDGDFAFLTLDRKKDNFVYSAPYLPLYLVAVSKRPFVKDIRTLAHLQDGRIAIENRFVNTDQLRLEKAIKWSRNPDTFDAFKQLADGRSTLLITSSLLLNEFNLLLSEHGETPLFSSPTPLLTAHFTVAIRESIAGAKDILNKFNKAIVQMQRDGTYNRLLQITWLLKDTDNDGHAEYISSADLLSDNSLAPQRNDAYALDNTPPAASPSYIIDGNKVSSWEDVMALLPARPREERKSLLDETIYSRMMRQW